MKKNIARVAIVATAAASVLVGFATSASATTGSVTTQDNGSAGPVHLWLDGTTYEAAAHSFGWSDNVIAAGSTSDVTVPLNCPSSATSANPFISTVANTLIPANWDASGDNAMGALSGGVKPVSLANVKPSGLINGAVGAVKASGGTYNLGVACTNNNGNTVVASFYRTITVTASTGAWVAAASDYVYSTPTISGLTGNAGANPNVADVLTASVATVPDGFVASYQWKVAGSNVGTDSPSYTVVDNDNDKTITVTVTYTRSGYTTVPKTSTTTLKVVGGSISLSGDVALSVAVLNAVDGTLSLDVPTGTTGSFGSASLQGDINTSKATGTLTNNVTVNDQRVHTRPGWDLTATVSSFAGPSSASIEAKQLGIEPVLVSAGTTAAGQVIPTARTAGTTLGAGNSYLFASATADNTIGATKLNANLSFVAPQWKPAGTYTGTLSLTLASK